MNYRIDDEIYGRFQEMILRESGLYFPEKKRIELEVAIFKALADAPYKNVEDYFHYLDQAQTIKAQQELARLINLLTVGETHYFRNSTQFDALAGTVLPALIKRKREIADSFDMTPPVMPQLRLWSAGCASGEEAYSLAILLQELIPDIENWRLTILATDINEDSLVQARQGIYSNWSFRETRALALRDRYFQATKGKYQLNDEIRNMVTFARHNLIDDPFPDVTTNTLSMDLILCRNVTIYFKPETTQRITARFYESLVEGGWLIVGHSEPSLHQYRAFMAHTILGTVLYQKTGQPTPMPKIWKTTATSQNGAAVKQTDIVKFLKEPKQSQVINPPRRTDFLRPLPARQQTQNQTAYDQARLWLSDGRVEEAVALLQQQIADTPQFAPAYCLLARAYADQGHWRQARKAGEQAQAIDPLLPEVYYVLAMVDEHEGHIEPAIENLKKLIYLDKERPLAYFNLAMLYKKRSQVGQARRALKNTIQRMQFWPPDKVIPDSGHTSAKSLAETAQKLLDEMDESNPKPSLTGKQV